MDNYQTSPRKLFEPMRSDGPKPGIVPGNGEQRSESDDHVVDERRRGRRSDLVAVGETVVAAGGTVSVASGSVAGR